MSEQDYQELTDEDYKNMSRSGLYKRASQIVNMLNDAGQKAGIGGNINMIIYTSLRSEGEKYIRNKNEVEPSQRQIERLVKTIYKNLVKQKDIPLDVDWIREVVFQESTDTGVGLMYTRLERVNSLIEKFTPQKEE